MTGRETGKNVLSIRWIVTGAAMGITALAVLAVGTTAERNTREALVTELEQRVVVEARNLALTASRALITDFPELTLAPIVREMEAGREDLAYAVVVDRDDVIRGHADARRIGEPFSPPPDTMPRESATLLLEGGEALLENGEIFLASAPVLHPNGHAIGRAWVAFDRGHVTSLIAATRQRQAVVVAGVLGAGVLVVLLIMGLVLRPVGALRAGLERIGKGDLETPVRLRARSEFGLLADTINEMATAIREAQDEKVEKERLAHEVELAREIQSSLLPHESFRAGDFEVTGAHRAAAEVGGDLWDVFPLEGGRVGILIADVSGKGLGGCLVTSMVSALMRGFRNEETSPARLLVRLEESLPLRPGTFITAFYGILDPGDGSIVFASAGHSPLLVCRGEGKCDWYRSKGIPIGAVRGGALARTLQDERIVLRPGDALVQYTDGVNEAFDPTERDQFGFGRLETAVKESAGHGASAVVERIRGDVRAWVGDQPPLDDETLLVVCRAGVSAPAPQSSRAPSSIGSLPLPEFDPVNLVGSARRLGHGIRFRADLDDLVRLHRWTAGCEGLDLPDDDLRVLEAALYELCANVVEHGYRFDSSSSFELWWLSCERAVVELRDDPRCRATGVFVLVDHGREYEPASPPADFQEADVRRRGRGIGLTIVRSAMAAVRYFPGTACGNVTALVFDPAHRSAEEVTNA